MTLMAPRTTMPLMRAMFTAIKAAITTTTDTRGGATRLSWRTRNRTRRPISWPISTNVNRKMIDSAAACR